MDKRLITTDASGFMHQSKPYSDSAQGKESNQSHLSEVDQLLLRTDMVLEQSQRDQSQLDSNMHSQVSGELRNNSYGGASTSRSNYGMNDPLMRDSRNGNEMVIREEEEDKFQSVSIHHTEQNTLQLGSRHGSYKRDSVTSKERTLEDELRSISQGMHGSEEQSFSARHRQERISQEIAQVKHSIHQQMSLDSQLTKELSQKKQGSSIVPYSIEKSNTLDEPEIIKFAEQLGSLESSQQLPKAFNLLQSAELNFNGTGSSSKLLSTAGRRNQDIQVVRRSSEMTGSSGPRRRKRSDRGTSSGGHPVGSSKVNTIGHDSTARFQINHKKGCPARSSTRKKKKMLSKTQGPREASTGVRMTVDTFSPTQSARRTRNERIQSSSRKQLTHSRGSKKPFTSKSSKRSSANKSGAVRSGSNNTLSATRKKLAKHRRQSRQAKVQVADAACSPVRFSGTFGQQQVGTNGSRQIQTQSVTSSAAADIGFMAQASYRSSTFAENNAANNYNQEILAEYQPQPISLMNQNFMLKSSDQSSSQNIFQNVDELQSQPNVNSGPVSNRIETMVGNSGSHRLSDRPRTSQDRVSTSEHKAINLVTAPNAFIPLHQRDNVRLTQTTVQVRQALQEAAEMNGFEPRVRSPKTKMQLNLQLLKKKQESQAQRSSVGSTKTLIEVQPTSAHSQSRYNQTSNQTRNIVVENTDCSHQHQHSQQPWEFVQSSQRSHSLRKRPQDLNQEQEQQQLRMTQKCMVCNLSSFKIHPSVYKAQQRVRERKFVESHKELTQHLRNPMTVAKQLKKHLKLQKTVKSQFDLFVGQAGKLAIKSLNRINSSSSIQPLRKQQFVKDSRTSDRQQKFRGQRSTRSVGLPTASRKANKIVRLRYAPHLVGSPTRPVDDARGAINIIVNEKHRCRSRSSGRSGQRSRKRSGKSSARREVFKIHRLLSADAGKQQRRSKRGYAGNENDYQIDDDVSSPGLYSKANEDNEQRMRQRHRFQHGIRNAPLYHSQPYSQRSYDTASLHDVNRSQSSGYDFRTGTFNNFAVKDNENIHGRGGQTRQNHSGIQYYQQQLQEPVSYRSHSSSSVQVQREALQRARLEQILQEKKNVYKEPEQRRNRSSRSAKSTSNKSSSARFETFNRASKGNSALGLIQPLRNQPNRVQPSRSRSHSSKQKSSAKAAGRRRRQHRNGDSRSVSGRSRSDQDQSNRRLKLDLSASPNAYGNPSHQESNELAQFIPSYEDQPQKTMPMSEEEDLANFIAHDKSGSLRLRIKKAQDLVTSVEKGLKSIHSPEKEDGSLASRISDSRQGNRDREMAPNASASNFTEEPHLTNQNSVSGDMQSNPLRRKMSSQFEERPLSREIYSSGTQSQGSKQITALRNFKREDQQHHIYSQDVPQYSNRVKDLYNHSAVASGRGQTKSNQGESLSRSHASLPRHTFVREVSGVKYDWRPIPRENRSGQYIQGEGYRSRDNQERASRASHYSDCRSDPCRSGPIYPSAKSCPRSQTYHQLPRHPERSFSGAHIGYNRQDHETFGQTQQPYYNDPKSNHRKPQREIIDDVRREFQNGAFPTNSSYMRIKSRRNGSSSYHKGFSRSPEAAKHQGRPREVFQAVTTKNENSRSRSRRHGVRSRSSRDCKNKAASLAAIYEQSGQAPRRAQIPKLRQLRELAAKRQHRPRRPVSFDSFNSSQDEEEPNDMGSARDRINHMEMRHRGLNFPPSFKAPTMLSPMDEAKQKRYCNHSRCSASKERPIFDEQIIGKGVSRSRSRGGGNSKLKTMAELKQSIRRLQRPTFSSKMYHLKKGKLAGHKGLAQYPTNEEYQKSPTEQPVCDRDPVYWQGQVEALSNTFSSYPKHGSNNPRQRSKSSKQPFKPPQSTSLQGTETSLMPLKQLKQISKVMNDIMGVGQQVQQLKNQLEDKSNELIKQLESRKSGRRSGNRQDSSQRDSSPSWARAERVTRGGQRRQQVQYYSDSDKDEERYEVY